VPRAHLLALRAGEGALPPSGSACRAPDTPGGGASVGDGALQFARCTARTKSPILLRPSAVPMGFESVP